MNPTVLHPDELIEGGMSWEEAWMAVLAPFGLPVANVSDHVSVRCYPRTSIWVFEGRVAGAGWSYRWDKNGWVCYDGTGPKGGSKPFAREPPQELLSVANDLLSAAFAKLLARGKS